MYRGYSIFVINQQMDKAFLRVWCHDMTYLSVLKDKRLQKFVARPRFRRHAFATVHRVCGFFQPRPIVQDDTGVNGLQVVLVRGAVCDHPEGLLFALPPPPPTAADGERLFLWPTGSSSGPNHPPPLSHWWLDQPAKKKKCLKLVGFFLEKSHTAFKASSRHTQSPALLSNIGIPPQ